MGHPQGNKHDYYVHRGCDAKLLREGILWPSSSIPAEMLGLWRYVPSVQRGNIQYQRAWRSVSYRVQAMPSGVCEQLDGPSIPLQQLLGGFLSEEARVCIL